MPTPNFPPNIRFDFPIARPDSGIPLGNGTLKISVWGDEKLCLTIARAEFDHNVEITNYTRAMLDADDVAAWRERLDPIGNANLELSFTGEVRPVTGTLGADGILQIALSDGRIVAIECAMDEELAWIDGVADAAWQLRSLGQETREICAPMEIQIADGCGFVWEFDEQQSLVAMVRQRDDGLFIATARGETEDAARAAVSRARHKPDINPIYYWKQFWRSAPRIFWPDAELQKQWNLALFQQAQASATTDVTVDFLAAFTRLLAQSQNDGIHVLPATLPAWSELSFDNIRCAGAFIVGASVEGGVVIEVRVRSEKDGILRLHPNAQTQIERAMSAGEEWIWRA